MVETTIVSREEQMNDLSAWRNQLQSPSTKTQLQTIDNLAQAGDTGLAILMGFLEENKAQNVTIAIGKAYQTLYQANTPASQQFLKDHFPNGVVPLQSERNIDYQPLQELLIKQDFEAADILTVQKMCELAGESAIKRKWVYFTEVNKFPITDLRTIDQLWLIYSEGKFGFSVQRQIWLSLGKDFNKLWSKIDWRGENGWSRYPNQFIWTLDAPQGHLPTSNQLRGSKVINAIFCHPAWNN